MCYFCFFFFCSFVLDHFKNKIIVWINICKNTKKTSRGHISPQAEGIFHQLLDDNETIKLFDELNQYNSLDDSEFTRKI